MEPFFERAGRRVAIGIFFVFFLRWYTNVHTMRVYVHENNGYYDVEQLGDMITGVVALYALIGLPAAVLGFLMLGWKGGGIGAGAAAALILLVLLITWIRKGWRFFKTRTMKLTESAERTLQDVAKKVK